MCHGPNLSKYFTYILVIKKDYDHDLVDKNIILSWFDLVILFFVGNDDRKVTSTKRVTHKRNEPHLIRKAHKMTRRK